jgi:hypothetical protein
VVWLREPTALPAHADALVFSVFVWTRFLWQVSRIDLRLVRTHLDRVDGLGFLSNTAYASTPLAVAHGGMLAGLIANRIFYLGAALHAFKVEIGVLVVGLLCTVLGPLLVFAPQLHRRTGGLRKPAAARLSAPPSVL